MKYGVFGFSVLWRKRWDSNPRAPCGTTWFRVLRSIGPYCFYRVYLGRFIRRKNLIIKLRIHLFPEKPHQYGKRVHIVSLGDKGAFSCAFARKMQEKLSQGKLLDVRLVWCILETENKEMTYNPEEFEAYPEILTAEQMRIVCHMSKRTAYYLLSSGLIPNVYNGKKTHCYRIRKSDIIAFVIDRAEHPEAYKAPANWYQANNAAGKKQFAVRPLPPPIPKEIMREYYTRMTRKYNDVMTVLDISELTGYLRTTIVNWINKDWLKTIIKTRKFLVPKCFLIDYLCSGTYHAIRRKSQKHIEALWKMHESVSSRNEDDEP